MKGVTLIILGKVNQCYTINQNNEVVIVDVIEKNIDDKSPIIDVILHLNIAYLSI